MKRKTKKLFTNLRIIILLVSIVLAVVAIHPNPTRQGVAIRSVITNGSAANAGILSPKPTGTPMSREVILSIDNVPIKEEIDYYDYLDSLRQNSTVHLHTTKGDYTLFVNEETDLGLVVYVAPTNNIRKGLDLQGGTRVLLQPETKLNQDDMNLLIDNMKQRLNVYGLSDLIIRESNDLPPPLGSGNQYILVEIAGATKEEVKDLLAKQGKFEAKVGNETVFMGGQDVKSVCRSADCAGIDPNQGCGQSGDAWFCRFRFSITLSQEAAERQAAATKDLQVITEENGERYLEKKLLLFLDDSQVDELNIGSDLKGRAVTGIQISGSGVGTTQQEAILDSLKNMKQLQTLLITGSLPVKIEISKMDAISPALGEEFIKNAILVGAIAIMAVAIVIFARYRKIRISSSMVVIMVSELIIILGAASLIGWNLDLAAIAGIIIALGTGVDHAIVITDETLKGGSEHIYDWKIRLKRALFIIMAAYFTTVVAMLPLVFAGAGLLKGFAITTIMGVSIGVFITRPAYAAIIEILVKD
jgi:preprotein translocase subunit SecD